MHDESKTMQALFMKPTKCAIMADCSVRTITRMCEQGQLPAVKLRGTWRVNRAEFLRILGVES